MAVCFQESGHAGNSWFYENSLIDNYARNNSSLSSDLSFMNFYWVHFTLGTTFTLF